MINLLSTISPTFILDQLDEFPRDVFLFIASLSAYAMLLFANLVDIAMGMAYASKKGRMSSWIAIIGAYKKAGMWMFTALGMVIEQGAGGFPAGKMVALLMVIAEGISIIEKGVLLEVPGSRFFLFMFRNRVEKYARIGASWFGYNDQILEELKNNTLEIVNLNKSREHIPLPVVVTNPPEKPVLVTTGADVLAIEALKKSGRHPTVAEQTLHEATRTADAVEAMHNEKRAL